MSTELTKHTLEVLAHGLKLKDQVMAGQPLLLEAENARLRQMLWADGEVRNHPDYGDMAQRPVDPLTKEFLGVRYALACWLDEIMISDPECPWSAEWAERSLESSIYQGSQERAHRFWAQAELVERRPSPEALEAYLWCVMLGFRGKPEDYSIMFKPTEWAERVRRRVQTAKQHEFALPADLGLKTDVPLLSGRKSFRTAGRLLTFVVAMGLFVAVILLVQKLSSN